MQTKGIRLWSKYRTLVSALSIGRFFLPITIEPFFFFFFFPFFLFRQPCLYISDSLRLFTHFWRILLKSVRRKASRMNTLLSAIFKFCTTNQLFKKRSEKNIKLTICKMILEGIFCLKITWYDGLLLEYGKWFWGSNSRFCRYGENKANSAAKNSISQI